MGPIIQIFDTVLLHPIINILLFFYQGLLNLGIPGAFGLSIIILTIVIRALLNPFYSRQMLLAKKMEELRPRLDELTTKHKDDKATLQKEQLKLYQETGINPAAGCLFAIVQIPVFIALYRVLLFFLDSSKGKSLATIADRVNKIVYADFLKVTTIDPMFFGINLAVAPSHFSQYGTIYLAIPVITGVLQYFQAQATLPKTKKVEGDKKNQSDMQTAMATQMRYLFPLMIGYFAYILPVGLSLYWNTFSVISIIQQKQHERSK